MTVSAFARRSAHMGRYAWWQLRDYLMDRGLPTALIMAFVTYFVVGVGMKGAEREMMPLYAKKFGAAEAMLRVHRDLTRSVLTSLLGVLVYMAAIFAANGLVAHDRKQGFYRFYFAKPVSPSRFYGQSALVNVVGFLAVFTTLAGIYHVAFSPLPFGPLLLAVAAVFACYVCVGFLLSAIAAYDWLSLVVVTVLANMAYEKFGEADAPWRWIPRLFPPVYETDDLWAALAAGTPLPMGTVAWFAGYGLACYLLALWVLRKRRLALS